MRKLDTFKGKIDVTKDSKASIDKVLSNLQDYLKNYEETDAAEIVEQLKTVDKNASHQDKLLSQNFLKAYQTRTETLDRIEKSIKKIKEDLIDEQDTKYRPGFFSRAKNKITKAARKTINVGKSIKEKAEGTWDFISGLFSKLMNLRNLVPMLIAGAVSFVVGGVKKIAKGLVSMAFSVIKWTGILAFKVAKFVVKTAIGGLKFVGKLLWGSLKFVSGMVKSAGSWIIKIASMGLSKIGGLLSSLWKSIKEKVSPKAKTPGDKNASTSNSRDAKSTNDSRKRNSKINGKGEDKGWFKKSKEALDSVKKKILPMLESKGLSKVAKAVGSSLLKLTTRAVPFLGWGLLAYDAYTAAKKSDSLTSFGVNLLDEISGGLISASLGDTGDKSAGQYIEALTMESNNSNSSVTSAVSSVTGIATSVSKSSLDIASSSKYSYPAVVDAIPDNSTRIAIDGTEVPGDTTVAEFDSFYNKFHNHKHFQWYYNKLLSGEMTLQQATQAITQNIQPSVSNSINITNNRTQELQAAKDQAVAEAVRMAINLDKQVVSHTANMVHHVAVKTHQSTVVAGDINPNHAIRHTGNRGAGDTQG